MRRALPVGLTVILLATTAFGQQAPTPDADRNAITRAALDYAESWYEGSVEKIDRALHPELAKRIVRKGPDGKAQLDHMGAMTLRNAVAAGLGRNTPADKQLKVVKLLDVYGNTAHVRLEMSDWIDYMHLARWNGQWKIINVLWEMKPKPGQSVKAEEAAVKRPAADYIESQYAGDAQRMERALHPDLAKRRVVTSPNGQSRLSWLSAMELWQLTREGVIKDTPKDKQKRAVVILDQFENIAFLKVEMTGWYDYMQVANWDGEWKVVNVLWERKPAPQSAQ
jgi:hypothetical protein